MTFKPQTRVGLRPPTDVAELFKHVLSDEQMVAMDVVFAVRATCQMVDNTVQLWLGPDGLSPSRMHMMIVLWAAGRPVPQMHIVRALRVSRATVSSVIEELRKAGHVTSVTDAADRRNALVALTPSGKLLARRMTESNATRARETLRELTVDERAELLRLLGLVRASFEKHGKDAQHYPGPASS